MATRTIVTSQPDVECDVCERRLLRGEQPDVFIAAGRRRIVCELCAPRAAHEGWLRESDSQSLTLPPMRPRRDAACSSACARSGRPPGEPATADAPPPSEPDAEPYDLFARRAARRGDRAPARPAARSTPQRQPRRSSGRGDDRRRRRPAPPRDADAPLAARASEGSASTRRVEQPSAYVQEAIAVFNASEFPRRVAGVARSLGAPR